MGAVGVLVSGPEEISPMMSGVVVWGVDKWSVEV